MPMEMYKRSIDLHCLQLSCCMWFDWPTVRPLLYTCKAVDCIQLKTMPPDLCSYLVYTSIYASVHMFTDLPCWCTLVLTSLCTDRII